MYINFELAISNVSPCWVVLFEKFEVSHYFLLDDILVNLLPNSNLCFSSLYYYLSPPRSLSVFG